MGGFGSGLHSWGFTLRDWAKKLAAKYAKGNVEEMTKRLWNDNFWDPKRERWTRKNPTGKLERGFCQFVLRPLKELMNSVMNESPEKYLKSIASHGVKLSKEEQCLTGKDLLGKVVMKRWLPAGATLFGMMVD